MLRGMFKKKHKESRSNKSLVDISFESDQYFDAGDGVEITKLAMRCVEEKPVQRPTMKEVVCCLRGLNVVKKFGHLLPLICLLVAVLVISYCKSSFEGMESATALVEYNYEALASITGGFSEENFIGDTLFGKVFRGKIQQAGLETQEVVVKIWVQGTPGYASTRERQESRLDNEIKLLTNSDLKGHPNLVKLIGFCRETQRLGVVYELNLLDTAEKLILQDDFKWLARIKVALEFACILERLHDQQLLHRSISAAHLMVDQAFSPRLFDFAMLVGGGFGEILLHEIPPFGCYGYIDPHICMTGIWSDKTDVFAYGVVLLGLIAKRVFDLKKGRHLRSLNCVHVWAWREQNEIPREKPKSKLWGMYKKHKVSQLFKSLVDKSLESDQYFDAGDGFEITELAMRCVEEKPAQRPTMKEVVCCLRELNVVKKFSHLLPKTSVGSSAGGGILPQE